jgi:hypothetical protein
MAINSNLILATDTTILLVPAGKKYAITTIVVCNYATTDDVSFNSSFNMHVIPSGDSKSNANKVLNTIDMPAQETFSFNTERLILEEGDSVVLNSPDSNRLSATISYLEV